MIKAISNKDLKEKRWNNLIKLAGSWSKETADKVKKMIYEDRKMPSRRFR